MRTLLILLLCSSVAVAQPKTKPAPGSTTSEQAAVLAQARATLKNLQDLLNTISYEDLSRTERDEVIKNSFTPNANQIFAGESVQIENDLDPDRKGQAGALVLPVKAYLLLFDTLYAKAPGSVSFSNVRPVVSQNPDGTLKVFYTAQFGSRNAQLDKTYAPMNRVAECQVRREGNGWQVLITRLMFEGAVVPSTGSALNPEDRKAIQAIAQDKIARGLPDLLNALTTGNKSSFEQDALIKKSLLPNPNQLFLNDGVIVEDDVDPNHTPPTGAVDTPVETYLRNLTLFYRKTPKPSIRFSNIRVVKLTESSKTIVQVAYTSRFGSKHTQIDKPFAPTRRLAEFQAERVGKRWSVLITRLAFETDVNPPKLPPPTSPKLKRQGWLMVLGGVVGLAGGYLTYAKLQTDYRAYTNRVNTLNAEYDQWRELTMQPAGSRMTPLSFSQYAGNGTYIAYGAGGAGLALTITGVAKLLKAKR